MQIRVMTTEEHTGESDVRMGEVSWLDVRLGTFSKFLTASEFWEAPGALGREEDR
jgi:hypothetical protein